MDSVSHERSSSVETKKKRRIFKCFSNYWKELKARSLNTPSILLLVYAALIPVCTEVLTNIIYGFYITFNTNCNPSQAHLDSKTTVSIILLLYMFQFFLFLSVVGYQILRLVVVMLFISVYGLVG